MKAIILCAGLGERLRPLTNDIPKPMIPIDNKPVLEYLILLCKKHNITEIAINTSYLPEKIKEYFGDGSKWGVKIHYSFEPELLGTSGAINHFRHLFDETFFVIYGDNITDLNLTKMLEFHESKSSLGTLYVYRENLVDEKTTPGCVVIDKNDRIQEIIEKPTEEEKEKLAKIPEEQKLINVGFYILEPEILKLIPPGFSDFPRDIIPEMLKIGKMYGYQEDCYFKEVGQLMRYEVAKEDIESKRVNLNL